MGKHTITSRLVKCPICGIEVKSRGLHAHLRLVHPNSDIKKELRKKVLSPLRPGERVIFSLSLWKGWNQTAPESYLIKHAGLTMDDIEVLADLFAVWAETGSIAEAMSEADDTAKQTTNKYIVRESEEEIED
jgi:hypothetical protein